MKGIIHFSIQNLLEVFPSSQPTLMGCLHHSAQCLGNPNPRGVSGSNANLMEKNAWLTKSWGQTFPNPWGPPHPSLRPKLGVLQTLSQTLGIWYEGQEENWVLLSRSVVPCRWFSTMYLTNTSCIYYFNHMTQSEWCVDLFLSIFFMSSFTFHLISSRHAAASSWLSWPSTEMKKRKKERKNNLTNCTFDARTFTLGPVDYLSVLITVLYKGQLMPTRIDSTLTMSVKASVFMCALTCDVNRNYWQ